jgi:hypothetical protein
VIRLSRQQPAFRTAENDAQTAWVQAFICGSVPGW